MDNNLHNIDEIFAKSLSDFSVDPPPHVWDNISGQLDATSGQYVDEVFTKGLSEYTVTPPAYVWDNIKGQLDAASGKRRARIGWILGSASAILIAFVGGYFIANSIGSASETHVSEKISNTHQTGIDVNHFWDLRHIDTQGESNSGGHTFTTNSTNTSNTVNDGGNSQQIQDDNRTVPVNSSGEHTPIVPSKNQDGGEENGKKTNAVTSDVNGPVEAPIRTSKGSTSVAALHHNEDVMTDNSITQNNVPDNNTQVEENRTEALHPSELATGNNNQNEKGNDPLTIKDETPTSFTILPYFSPTYTFRNSSINSMDGIQNAFGTDSRFSERPNFSYSTGVLVGYNFTPRLTVFIGAAYSTFSNTTNRNDIHSKSFDQISPGDSSTYAITSAGELGGINIVPTQGTPENPTYIKQDYQMNPAEIGSIKRITQTFSYVEVPVLARYRFFGPKVGLIMTGGLSTGFIVQNSVTVETDHESKNFGQTNQIRNFNMNAIFGVGIEARILPFMYLNIEPTFKYSFLNWSMDSRFKMNPISIGINTGLAFKL